MPAFGRRRSQHQPEPASSPLDALIARVRGEYREMPGLRLTPAEACRFWQIDRATCEAVFRTLVEERFLRA
jgi:hypothetical protein